MASEGALSCDWLRARRLAAKSRSQPARRKGPVGQTSARCGAGCPDERKAVMRGREQPETIHGQPEDDPDNRQHREDGSGLVIAVGEQTLRKELADLGQDDEELFGAERADFLEDERCVHREQLRRLHDRFLWKYSIDAIALVNC